MSGSSADGAGREGRRKRRGLLGWLAKRLVISFAIMSLLSLAGVGYMAHRDRTLAEEALRGLDAVAEKLEQNDKDSAAEGLRKLRAKLESLREASGGYSERAKRALERIRSRSEDLYREAKEAIDGEGSDGVDKADPPDAGSAGDADASEADPPDVGAPAVDGAPE
ncbi:MAG: hypothetical protein ACYS9X_09110 [Planctomycetota bacterium]